MCSLTKEDSEKILTNNRRGSRSLSWDNGEEQATPSGPMKNGLKQL